MPDNSNPPPAPNPIGTCMIEIHPHSLPHRHQRPGTESARSGSATACSRNADSSVTVKSTAALAAAQPWPHGTPFFLRRQLAEHRAHRGCARTAPPITGMPGIRNVKHLADIEALQNCKNILLPRRERFGRSSRVRAFFHFQYGYRTVFRVDCREREPRFFGKSENGHNRAPPKSMLA